VNPSKTEPTSPNIRCTFTKTFTLLSHSLHQTRTKKNSNSFKTREVSLQVQKCGFLCCFLLMIQP